MKRTHLYDYLQFTVEFIICSNEKLKIRLHLADEEILDYSIILIQSFVLQLCVHSFLRASPDKNNLIGPSQKSPTLWVGVSLRLLEDSRKVSLTMACSVIATALEEAKLMGRNEAKLQLNTQNSMENKRCRFKRVFLHPFKRP